MVASMIVGVNSCCGPQAEGRHPIRDTWMSCLFCLEKSFICHFNNTNLTGVGCHLKLKSWFLKTHQTVIYLETSIKDRDIELRQFGPFYCILTQIGEKIGGNKEGTKTEDGLEQFVKLPEA